MTYDLGCQMKETFRLTVVRRVRLREELKPLKAYGHSGRPAPDWLLITHVTGQKGYESFDLQFLKLAPPACGASTGEAPGMSVTFVSSMCYETLRIAKAQAHADI